MTTEELMNIPKGMSFKEYDQLLKEKKKLEKQLAKICADIDFENDSLEMLADEKGSIRYNRHLEAKSKAEAKKDKIQAKHNVILNILKRQA